MLTGKSVDLTKTRDLEDMSSIDWVKQTQQWADCRIVVAANAALWWEVPNVIRPSHQEEWRVLVTRAGAEHGAAITPESADVMLGVTALRYESGWDVQDLVAPSSIGIRDPKAGFHCVLLVRQSRYHCQLVGVEWDPTPREMSHIELEELLFPKWNVNRKAELFLPLRQPTQALGRIKSNIVVPPPPIYCGPPGIGDVVRKRGDGAIWRVVGAGSDEIVLSGLGSRRETRQLTPRKFAEQWEFAVHD